MIGANTADINKALTVMAITTVIGGVLAKYKNKNIFLGGILGFVSGYGILYASNEFQTNQRLAKQKEEYDITKNMTQEEKNKYIISKGGKIPVAVL
jgi:hypothetical protein